MSRNKKFRAKNLLKNQGVPLAFLKKISVGIFLSNFSCLMVGINQGELLSIVYIVVGCLLNRYIAPEM